MTKTTRRTLLETGELVIKGLVSNSIPEPPVDVFVADELVGRFHGIEVYERSHGMSGFPQTVADLVSNTYLRLTYQKPDHSSATFGTSFVGSFSFRTGDNTFHHIPTVTRVELNFEPQPRVRISGRFGDLAETTIERSYSPAIQQQSAMTLAAKFIALKDVELSQPHLGIDAFRLFSISSMYSGRHCYDGNLITWAAGEHPHSELDLRTSETRGRYLFSGRNSAQTIGLIKQFGSNGRSNTPGSPDSPSVRASVVEASLPLDQLGVQAVLADSTNCDDDSLSIWSEWLEVQPVLREGLIVSSLIECTAFNDAVSTLGAESLSACVR